MKKHLLNIWFDTLEGQYSFIGLVNCENNTIYPSSLFKSLFGFDLPPHSKITIL